MKFLAKLVALAGIGLTTTAFAVDLSKVPEVRRADLYKLNETEYYAGKRPEHCTFNGQKQNNDPACYDGVLSQNEAFIRYANEIIHLGKPLTANNKAKENTAGLNKIIEKIVRVYSGTENAIVNKEPELNRIMAGLFNTFNNAVTDVEPYILSIAEGNYDKNTLERLSTFNEVFTKGWKKSAPAMIEYNGITEKEAENSTAYYKQEITKIRNILTQLNKYYQ